MTPLERFAALDQKDKDRFLEKHYDYNTCYHDWWDDSVYECFVEDMAAKHVVIEKGSMYFSGFSSQGDGACFKATISDWPKFLAEQFGECFSHFARFATELTITSTHRGNYSHSQAVTHDVTLCELNPYDEERDPFRYQAFQVLIDKAVNDVVELDKAVNENLRGFMDELYSKLEEEYDGLQSEETVVANMDANETLAEALDEMFEKEEEES